MMERTLLRITEAGLEVVSSDRPATPSLPEEAKLEEAQEDQSTRAKGAKGRCIKAVSRPRDIAKAQSMEEGLTALEEVGFISVSQISDMLACFKI